MPDTSSETIRLRGARENNLKGFDLDLPLGKLIVVTGLSGTGKSSLVFDTLHAEGQRRYVETFSPYTRQFLEMLDRPDVDSIENIRPSIAIQQSNTVKTSRSTVGTMTELTDFFKVWFCHAASLYDPETGEKVEDDNPQSIWKKTLERWEGRPVILAFEVKRPEKMAWAEIFKSLRAQGYTRVLISNGAKKIDDIDADNLKATAIHVIQDRIKVEATGRSRFIEAAQTALHFGKGEIHLFDSRGKLLAHLSEGLHSPKTGKRFRPPAPAMFSFNSPIGACPRCRGFGRIIEIDYRLVVPDRTLSIGEGAIRAFQGSVYSESQRDLMRAAKKARLRTDVPYRELTEEEKEFIIEGEPEYGKEGREWPRAWYGVRRFFNWLETNTYKMHVRVFLSKYRSYTRCHDCEGTRLKPAALNWKWRGNTLPALYLKPVSELLALVEKHHRETDNRQVDIAAESILSRLRYLEQVGLGYLTLDRSSRTLSGGEVERVNLTSCLGTSLVDTLFVLDEPSIGLHSRDIDRLIAILKRLTSQGNTVVVVEHDEAIMRAADLIIELGPRPGAHGGSITCNGNLKDIADAPGSITGAYLSGRETIPLPEKRRPVRSNGKQPGPRLYFHKASKHNIRNLDFDIPLRRLVCVSGVSGSGKSTLLNNVIHQGLLAQRGRVADDPAQIESIESGLGISEVVMVDQSPVSRTPRSNPALYTEAWNPIRELFANTGEARSAGMNASSFSFNSGDGRCDHCGGLGHERVEMQFMADVYVTCPVCEGRRFKPEALAIRFNGKSIDDVLALNVDEAAVFFGKHPKIHSRLQTLIDVGLGYLPLGQPLNTLSGGESQRLKLVKYLSRFEQTVDHALLLLDEPTTGLHRHDIKRLISVLQQLVEQGHSLVVIEHHLDILKSADWIIEMGPEAGSQGGEIVYTGPPEGLAKARASSASFMADALKSSRNGRKKPKRKTAKHTEPAQLMAAEDAATYNTTPPRAVEVLGAREHNLRNLSVQIPHRQISVITGISGSGKSSLAFDIIFAEGQRRFMESMSPYARQFVEQLPRPEIDRLSGIPPTVAIEQRVTRGTRKSTVATVTEVAQYLRLLYARIGIQHSLTTGEPLVALKPAALLRLLEAALEEQKKKRMPLLYLCAPLIRGRKGHYEPLANWAANRNYDLLRIDGQFVRVADFKKLDRYREHDIEVVTAQFQPRKSTTAKAEVLKEALRLGKGACFLASASGKILSWLSTTRTDPVTGEAYPELDPKHFSWNSARGWCPTCRGHGRIYKWMAGHNDYPEEIEDMDHGSLCPDCEGGRLNPVSRCVRLHLRKGDTLSLPELLRLTPGELLAALRKLKLDRRSRAIIEDVRPEIEERLKFMGTVGLDYLTLDRATNTLSGGEAQRIRLAAQLGSNLSGVLYVLDEPSIGLHARDNSRLLKSIESLRDKGNTLIIVEHDEDTMRHADGIIDLGPGAGIHGGELLANGPLKEIRQNKNSLTGRYLKSGIAHPRRGSYRELPPAFQPRSRKPQEWLVAKGVCLRNLKGDDLHLPLGRLIMVCGISGAGKSTLVRDLLQPAVRHASKNMLKRLDGRAFLKAGLIETDSPAQPPFKQIVNGNGFRHVIEVDQNPIGKTPRSTPATYIGAFDIIRQFFGSIPEARMRGYNAGTFSFNTKGGRCETCKGAGRIKLEMSFMPDTYVACEDCGGRRYGQELEEIRWKDKNISGALAMTFEEAAEFFDFHSRLHAMLMLMVETGLGYLTLGQSSPTLSGGEAQRLKLVSELAKGLQTYKDRSQGIVPRNLYILEEPTIGLHLSDCEKLIDVLHRLVDQGHTVIVIEHHTDLIAEADYVVEIGPEGGEAGGEILYQGPVTGLPDCKRSPTAPFLKGKIGARDISTKRQTRQG